jgi:uncharacterized protein YjbI with pentapeptide repeats
LKIANLTNATLILAKLDGANLSGANLTGANLDGADLTNANLKSAYLNSTNTIISSAILCNTTLPNGTVGNTGCPDYIKPNPDLRGPFKYWQRYPWHFYYIQPNANLMNAYLRDADLSHATVFFADIRNANLKDAMVYGAIGILDTKRDSSTICPNGKPWGIGGGGNCPF